MKRHDGVPSHISAIRWNIFFIVMGLGIAVGLFYYGIKVPFELRLRGDAWSYMDIAHQFSSFGEALHYVGVRAPGFPLFDYVFLYLDATGSIVSQVNVICLTLFLLHVLVSFWVCFVCVKCRLFITSSVYFGLLFFVLVAYPAMVMHTTTPLTDVLGVDLLIIGFSLFVLVSNEAIPRHPERSEYPAVAERSLTSFWMSWGVIIFSGLISGAVLGYAILVRPAYWLGVVGFLTVYIGLIGVNCLLLRDQNYQRPVLMWIVTLFTAAAVIWPTIDHCREQYHTLCLLDPKEVDIMMYIRAGLTSARTAWDYNSGMTPFYPDAFLVKHFHDRCPVTSITGSLNSDNSNLLSCLYHSPSQTIVYFLKKLIGLFDTFRMTPYTESITPVWYIWFARSFSSFAFVGFWILLWEGAKKASQLIVHRRSVSPLLAAVWFFCIIQVSVQSILHVEERYALPWIPFCIIALILKIKAIQDENYPINLRWMGLMLASWIVFGYFVQVLIWDYGMIDHTLS